MDDSRLFIIGAKGQLGKALAERFPKALAVDVDELDMTDAGQVEQVDWAKYDVILNAAAYTNVDGAETPEGRMLAWKINVTGVTNLARAAIKHGLALVHVSTDYVFDGTKNHHKEDEPVAPLGVYGQTKAAADAVVACVERHYIFRISWLIGDGPNFVRTMMGLAQKDVSPTVVDDQVGRLTFTPRLVEGIEHLLATKAAAGIYNLSNSGEPASWAEITREIFRDMGRDDLKVTGTSTKEYFAGKMGIAPRPLLSTLDLRKIALAGVDLPDWREDLAAYVKKEMRQ